MVARPFDMAAHEARLDRLIRGSFSASFMSNSKWRKAFFALSAPELGIDQLVWKFGGRAPPVRGAVPDKDCLGEHHIRDAGFSVFPYKEIEWVTIPPTNIPLGFESVPFKHRPQDLSRAKEVLDAAGQFEMAISPEGLKVYGYR